MKSKILFLMIVMSLLSVSVAAQDELFFKLKGGITVAARMETVPQVADKKYLENLGDYAIWADSTFTRYITDSKSKILFGYELEILSENEPGKFRIAIRPLSRIGLDSLKDYKVMSIPKYPGDITVNDGDTISLGILENPQTKIEIVEYIKITRADKRFGGYFSERKLPKDFTLDDIQLKLSDFKIFSNNVKFSENERQVFGQVLFFSVPDKGRFILSPFPQKGYDFQKIGIITDNKLTFTFNGDKYEIFSKSTILGDGGTWNVWVMHDSAFQTPVAKNFPYLFPTGSNSTVKGILN